MFFNLFKKNATAKIRVKKLCSLEKEISKRNQVINEKSRIIRVVGVNSVKDLSREIKASIEMRKEIGRYITEEIYNLHLKTDPKELEECKKLSDKNNKAIEELEGYILDLNVITETIITLTSKNDQSL